MELLQLHVDLVAGSCAMLWGAVVTLVPRAEPLGKHVSATAAFAFGLVALSRWAYGAA